VIRLATYVVLDLAATGCLVTAVALSASPREVTFVAAAAGAGAATLAMGAMLLCEEVRGRSRERAALLATATKP